MILAAKCAPREELLAMIAEAGIGAVELWLDGALLHDIDRVAALCARYPLRYALHAPNDACDPARLGALARAVGARIVVLHDIYFDDEWPALLRAIEEAGARPCIENISSIREPMRVMRRYGAGLCLDLEHLQLECAGVYREEFLNLIARAEHVHLTGYAPGSDRWHTHLNAGGEHTLGLLDMLREKGYRGMVVSEARTSLQSPEEFRAVREFFDRWRDGAEGAE
jgi:sugar phosphate isomerase/epimerase